MWHLVLLLVYSTGLIALGLWIGRRVRGSGDFFVAGRSLGPGLIFATVLAANIGAGSTVGATGVGFDDGVSAWWWNGSAGIGALLLALWIGPRIWRLAREHNFYTAGDFLEHRYGREVRGIAAALIWLGTLSILAGQLIGVSAIFETVIGVPRWVGAVLGGVVMVTYFVAGGLLSSAWVNLVQLVVIVAGFSIAAPLVLANAGGWEAIVSSPAAPERFTDPWFSRGMGSGWTFLALLVPAFITSPGLLQKAYGASSERAVRVGIGLSAVVLMLFALLPMVLGMAARVRHPDLASPNLALPAILVSDLPLGLGALALAAVFSAEVSSADAVLFMLSTSMSQDLYKRFLNPAATDLQLLRVARATAIVGGLLGIGLATVLPTVVAALGIFYSLLGVTLFFPIVAGLHSSRAGSGAALASIAAGVGTVALVGVTTGGAGFGYWTPNVLGLIAAAAAFALGSLLPRKGESAVV
ncbi:MAG TPA: sodium:solute symporter family protein [Vicinamibacterales bacterium]|nr:sodium:solute symporter family protein [Vicinamibacterales bacterium]